MLAAYSRLKLLLEERSLSRADLQRSLAEREHAVDVKTLYRLADPDRSLERIDLRAVGAICRVLGVGLDELIVFAESDQATLRSFSTSEQQRLDQLMSARNEGTLTEGELDELRALVIAAEEIARSNARRLTEHRRYLTTASSRRAAPR